MRRCVLPLLLWTGCVGTCLPILNSSSSSLGSIQPLNYVPLDWNSSSGSGPHHLELCAFDRVLVLEMMKEPVPDYVIFFYHMPHGRVADASVEWVGRVKDEGYPFSHVAGILRHSVFYGRIELGDSNGTLYYTHNSQRMPFSAEAGVHSFLAVYRHH